MKETSKQNGSASEKAVSESKVETEDVTRNNLEKGESYWQVEDRQPLAGWMRHVNKPYFFGDAIVLLGLILVPCMMHLPKPSNSYFCVFFLCVDSLDYRGHFIGVTGENVWIPYYHDYSLLIVMYPASFYVAIWHWSPMQIERSQSEVKRKMLETRFTLIKLMAA